MKKIEIINWIQIILNIYDLLQSKSENQGFLFKKLQKCVINDYKGDFTLANKILRNKGKMAELLVNQLWGEEKLHIANSTIFKE